MPEIIDLEVAKENILKKVGNKKLSAINVTSLKVLQNTELLDLKDSLEGGTLVDIERVSKVLAFIFDNGQKLALHLMLHGDFCWEDKSNPSKNVVCSMEFENGETVLIKDWSSWMKLELEDKDKGFESDMLNKSYGIDPFSDDFSLAYMIEVLNKRSRSNIKAVLMDQELISGIGNAYTDETLWHCGIDPRSKCGNIIKANKVEDLYNSIKTVLAESLDIVRDLSKGEEIAEQERDFMKVYRKDGGNCVKCSDLIIKIKVAGRDTFVCEKCQTIY